MNSNYYRPFKTFDEQINILKSRGLIINDIENAKIILSTSTYYELINGYQNWFTTSKDKYMPEISIEFLNEFYYFDHGFQNILFLHSVYVETSFKVCLSYVLAGKYGEHQKDYLTGIPNNIINKFKNYIDLFN
ncbi:Abi family protein [Helcococcus bovis]|uniref:Abi family protein n=1 Tax=Helcococcus bovis TaxID=3153252 RepID=UPI0038BA5CF0